MVVEGPDASGKTDLVTSISSIAKGDPVSESLKSNELGELFQAVRDKNYLQIRLEGAEGADSIPMSILKELIATESKKGVLPGQPLLIMWDDIDASLQLSLHQQTNHEFLEEMHRPLGIYENLTFVCSVTASSGGGSEIIGTSAGPEHFLQL